MIAFAQSISSKPRTVPSQSCISELSYATVLTQACFRDPALLGIFRAKIPSPATYRSLILEGHRFPAQQALQEGLVDGLGGRDEVLKFIQDRELTKKGQSGVYGGLKEEMYREQLTLLTSLQSSAEWSASMGARLQNRRNDMDRRLENWSGKVSGSKL